MDPILRLGKVEKRFGGLRAVDGVTADVPEGQVLGLIGPNGSGKTTLFNVISGVLKPDGGTVTFRGRRIDGAEPHAIFEQGIVRCFQNPRLFPGMTVMENALVPPRGQVGERLTAAPFPRRWSDQEARLAVKALQTLAAQQLSGVPMHWATEISGGQMKLLEVSRALMGEPRLLLLDEPTAGVAPKLAREIFDGISALRRDLGLTFVVIEHRLDVLFDYVDRVLVMHEGRVIFDGSPADAAKDPVVVDAYLGG